MSVEVVENLVNGGSSNGGDHLETVAAAATGAASTSNHGEGGGGAGGSEDSYDDAFPSLPSGGGAGLLLGSVWSASAAAATGGAETGASKLQIKKHQHVSQIIRVTPEERKAEATFGNETKKKCEEIASTLGVKVETVMSKDQTLHVVISGNEDKVLEAKRAIINELKVETEKQMKIPKEQHKFLIGKSGAILKELQEKTCTKIQVPKSDANTDQITIRGLREDVSQAMVEIQAILDEQSKTSVERLTIPKLYHPWLRGINNEIATDISTRTGAKVNIPPAIVDKDEIVVSGERDKVEIACTELRRIFEAKRKGNVKQIMLQIPKSQHKLIIGKNGQTVHDIFKEHDVYVQVPKLDSSSEMITLVGEEARLGAAVSQVITKSNSVVALKLDVPSWMHRELIGEKGAAISKITTLFPNTHVKFEADDKITIDGPPDEVEQVREKLEASVNDLRRSMTCEEVNIEPRLYPQLLGQKKTDAHVIARLNKDHAVVIRLPTGAETGSCTSNTVRIQGPPEGVRRCKQELIDIAARLVDERSKDIIIDHKFHSNLIGKGGKTLNDIRAKFNDVQINIPPAAEKSDVVTIRGNKNDVEKCFKHLQQLVKDMQESNYKEEIQIVKEFHRIIIGKGGAFIRKIREDTNTRIDIPSNESDSDAIVITGKQENVLKARKLIDDKIKELVNIKEEVVEIPHKYHNALIGKQGIHIQQIRRECGGVIISFPPESSPNDDRITLRGTADDIKRAKAELLKMAELRGDLGYSEEISVRHDYHKFLVGRKGTNVSSLREKYDVRIVFPNAPAASSAVADAAAPPAEGIITIMGKKENVKAARVELEEAVKSLEEQVTDEVNVDSKWHKTFTNKQGKLISEISKDYCNVKISFPKGANATNVQIKGPKDAVEAAKKRILEHVHRLENQVTIQVAIPQQFHAALIGKKGSNSQRISEDYHVKIQFHAKNESTAMTGNDKSHAPLSTTPSNGDGDGDSHDHSQEDTDGSSPSPSNGNSPAKTNGGGNEHSPDIVLISGFKDDCEKAREALLLLMPIREDVPFPAKFHRELLADKAKILKDLQQNHNVQVNVPKKPEKANQAQADYVTVIGSRESVDDAREELNRMLDEMEMRNYAVELSEGINLSEMIPFLRGRNGTEAEKMSRKFDVRLDFSKKGEPDRIVIRGLREKVEECVAFLRKKIEEEESKLSQEISIDSRVHSRIIGGQGKTLAKIQEKFKVEIKFPDRNSDVVIVKGTNMDAIDDACEHLKNLEEDYMQDVVDRDRYTHPSSKSNDRSNDSAHGKESKGFVVRGAPWEHQQQQQQSNHNSPKHHQNGSMSQEPVPDTNNMDLFPTISAADGLTAAASASVSGRTWGPARK